MLLHGLTATRRYVVHGSRTLAREGYRMISYDARGHGGSTPAADGYAYPKLAADLGAVLDDRVGEEMAILAGHSMGAHTLTAYALERTDRVAAVVVIAPATMAVPPDEATLAYWDRLAEGLEQGGVDGFLAAYDRGLDPKWRETLLRIARTRLEAHEHPSAVARALRDIPRSLPFEALTELEHLDLPALVVGSRDEADPGHPRAVAEAWAARLPQATVIGEEPGESPLAWQGGRLSREIARFCDRDAIRERLQLRT